MKHTFLRVPDSIVDGEMEQYIVIATNTYDFIIIRDLKIVSTVSEAHNQDITQILVLTDYYTQITFVTLSLDGNIKFWNDEGPLDSVVEYPDTQFVNGCIVPSKQDYFLVSTVSEDDENSV